MEPKKKRGRKPKNKMIINNNPKFDQDNKIDNLIALLQINKKFLVVLLQQLKLVR